MTRADLVRDAAEALRAAGVPDPGRDARVLMRWAAGLDPAELSACLGATPPPDERTRFQSAIARREAREPVSHITGLRLFWGREFEVGPDVLDPRPETETLIAAALGTGPRSRILDLGTGSGCLLLTLLAEWPGARGTGVDLCPRALAIARRNARRLGVDDRADLVEGDWLDGLEGPFDLIVSNPPYISAAEMVGLDPELRHEPRLALCPGGDGLGAYRRLSALRPLLAPGGQALFEIGPAQSIAVSGILSRSGLRPAAPIPDMDGRPRVIPVRH